MPAMPVNHLPEKICSNGEPHQKDNAEDPGNGGSAHMHMTFVSDLLCDFEDDIEFDRHSERKAGNADDHPNRCLLDANTSRNKSETASATRG